MKTKKPVVHCTFAKAGKTLQQTLKESLRIYLSNKLYYIADYARKSE